MGFLNVPAKMAGSGAKALATFGGAIAAIFLIASLIKYEPGAWVRHNVDDVNPNVPSQSASAWSEAGFNSCEPVPANKAGLNAPLKAEKPDRFKFLCSSTFTDRPQQKILIGRYYPGSDWDAKMQENYWKMGSPTFPDEADSARPTLQRWRSYDIRESDGSIWCKVGFVSATNPVVAAVEIASVRTPSAKARKTDPALAVDTDRGAGCLQLKEIARVIDPALEHTK